MPLLEDILAAQGGLEAFRQYKEIHAKLSIGGKLITARGISGKPRKIQIKIKTQEIRAEISPYPKEGLRGVYTPQKTWIENENASLQKTRNQPRARFAWGALHFPWDDLDLLYFFGYALWNYLMTPFLFTWPGVTVEEGQSKDHNKGQERWRSLIVHFPEEVPSHCKTQTFYFDERGLLRRLDYTADIFGSMARGAHYCDEHKNFGGFMVPTRREVFPKLGGLIMKFTNVMEGQIEEVSFIR
jgi:hypothetical protein